MFAREKMIVLRIERANSGTAGTGEESPNGAPRKMRAFCGVPGLEREIKITRETNILFGAYINTTKPRPKTGL